MEHITEFEILELLAGNLSPERQQRIRDHISACTDCAHRLAQAQQTWDLLDNWTADNPDIDISDSVVAQAEKLRRTSYLKFLPTLSNRRFLSVAVKVAASIIIAVGIGAMSGVHSAQKALSTDPTVLQSPDYLAALSLQWSSDLNWSVLEEHELETEADE